MPEPTDARLPRTDWQHSTAIDTAVTMGNEAHQPHVHQEPGRNLLKQPRSFDVRRPLSALLNAVRELVPHDEKVPYDEIDQYSVAEAIRTSAYNAVRARMGQNPWSDFTVVDVLTGLGYIAPLKTADYQQKFPREYCKARNVLREIDEAQIIETQFGDVADSHHEATFYHILQPDKIEALIERNQQLKQQHSARH